MSYYPRLRDLREDKDLSIRKLADIMYLQRTTYHNYETGKREIPFELAISLANLYDVSLDYVAGITNNPYINHDRNKTENQLSASENTHPAKSSDISESKIIIDCHKTPSLFLLNKKCKDLNEPQINRLIAYAQELAKEKPDN